MDKISNAMLPKACVLLVFVSLFTCNGVSCNGECNQGYIRCSTSILCCCKGIIANCQNYGKKLTFIPELPDKIEEVRFMNNFLPSVNVTTFKNITHLHITKLKLTSNQIVNISKDAFSGLHSLRVLYLDGNSKINKTQLSLSFGSILRTGNVTISLCEMGITEVKNDTFQFLTSANVSKIVLDQNRLTHLDFTAFKKLPHLQGLSVHKNQIRDISLGSGHRTLEHLILSENEIARNVPKFCYSNGSALLFPNLLHLDLSNNFISELNRESWSCLKRLQFLALASNVVRNVPSNVFASLTNLFKLNLEQMTGNLRTIGRHAFNNSKLEHLNLQDNSVIMTPQSSLEIFHGCSNLKTVIISGSNLQVFNETELVQMFSPLKQLEKLVAVKCKIRLLPRGIFKLLQKLKAVVLDGNNIETLDDAFTVSTSLSYISLQSNRIRVLDKNTFPADMPPSLHQLNLALNPFDCTCEMRWFRITIGNSGKIGNVDLTNWPREYTCSSPSKMSHKLFKDYNPTESECKNTLLIVLLCVASLLLSVTVAFVVGYRYKWYISLWFYKRRPRRRNTEREALLGNLNVAFRGYIIYDMEDRHFVHNDLRVLIENKMQYKLKLWGRDGGYGGIELEEMADSIYESEHVLAVISKTSLVNEWVKFQIYVAMHRQLETGYDNLMFVLLEDIECKSLSKSWCVMLTRLPTARWCATQSDIKRRVFEQQLSLHLGI